MGVPSEVEHVGFTGCMAWTRGYSLSPRACLWAGRGSGSSLGFPSEAGLKGRVSMDSCLLESLSQRSPVLKQQGHPGMLRPSPRKSLV